MPTPAAARLPLLLGCVVLVAACGGGDSLPNARATSAEPPFFPSTRETAGVADVLDGETLLLTDGRRVRLLGVDAPGAGEACAAEAQAYLGVLALGEQVELDVCRTPPPAERVPSGYVTAYVVVPGRSFVNLEMLRSGRAQFRGTVGACGGDAADARLSAGQAEAVEARRGVFGRDACAAPPPPADPPPTGRPAPPPPGGRNDDDDRDD